MRVELVAGNDTPLSVAGTGAIQAVPFPRGNFAGFFDTILDPAQLIIAAQLERVAEVSAVYVCHDEEGVLHVFSVVPEHTERAYRRLMDAEEQVRDRLSDVSVQFHIRAHQGRRPEAAVPLTSDPIFVR